MTIASPALHAAPDRVPRRMTLIAYGAFGMPLAFAALPLYVMVPDLYSQRFGLSLALIGGLLLACRLLDALVDPVLGYGIDRMRSRARYGIVVAAATPAIAGGFAILFNPPTLAPAQLAVWLLAALLVTCFGYSAATIAYQAWGAALARRREDQAGVVAWREGFGLLGVVLAGLLPQWLDMGAVSVLLAVLLAGSVALLATLPPVRTATVPVARPALLAPLRDRAVRSLFGVFVVNGIASAVPATLVLFFVRDALGLADWGGPLLALYFLAGGAAMPAWVFLCGRLGLVHSWLAGMALAIAAFAWVLLLPGLPPQYALPGFAAVAVLSGLALGADLVAPAAMLAGMTQRSPGALGEGACFGLWNLATKLNLALAAGLALPLLQLLGYRPGSADPTGTQALTLAYGLLPCLLKLIAALMLWRARGRLGDD